MAKQSLAQTVKQTLGTRLSPSQIQVAKLLELSICDLEERIQKELEENPALEEVASDAEDDFADNGYEENQERDDAGSGFDEADALYDSPKTYSDDDYDEYDSYDVSDYELAKLNRSQDESPYEKTAVSEISFRESLLDQLAMLDTTDREREIAEYLIGNLNEKGYLEIDNATIVNELSHLSTTEEEVESIIRNLLQHLDPAGIAARNLQECLLLQLDTLETEPVLLNSTKLIVKHYFDELTSRHYETIMTKTGISSETMKQILTVIQKLNPYPGSELTSQEKASNYITPDFSIVEENGKLQLSLNNNYIPKLKISDDFVQNYQKEIRKRREDKLKRQAEADEVEQFVKERVRKADEFIHSLSIREQTMLATMREILRRQEDFFLSGNASQLKPMILEDIAKTTGYDKSTISRVTNGKYVRTIFGNIALKSLFSESIGDKDVSSHEVKEFIKRLIEEENKSKPLSDDKLEKLLEAKGYKIARRTIAKYREELKIPVARLRKDL